MYAQKRKENEMTISICINNEEVVKVNSDAGVSLCDDAQESIVGLAKTALDKWMMLKYEKNK